ncbi:hypothetical protein D3C87_2036040 [compost metagenome]
MSVRSKSIGLSEPPQGDLFFPDHDGRETAYSWMVEERKNVSAGLETTARNGGRIHTSAAESFALERILVANDRAIFFGEY